MCVYLWVRSAGGLILYSDPTINPQLSFPFPSSRAFPFLPLSTELSPCLLLMWRPPVVPLPSCLALLPPLFLLLPLVFTFFGHCFSEQQLSGKNACSFSLHLTVSYTADWWYRGNLLIKEFRRKEETSWLKIKNFHTAFKWHAVGLWDQQMYMSHSLHFTH